MPYKSSLLRTCFGVSSNYPVKGGVLISHLIVSHPLSPSLLCPVNLLFSVCVCVCVAFVYSWVFKLSASPFLVRKYFRTDRDKGREAKGLKFFVLIVFQIY